jgi:BNR repeat protein
MRSQTFRRISSITLSALLICSLFIIANSSVSHASSTSPDEVAAASGSNRFVVWSDKTPGNWEIFFRRSTDNAATWKPIVNLSNEPGSSTNPEIAVSGANVYLVWSQSNAAGTLWDISFRRSTDNGATWKPTVKVASNVGGTAPQVVSAGSNVYVLWEQNNGEIYVRRSTNNGATWQAIVNLSNNPGASTDGQIAVSGANVYVMWFQRSAADSSLTDVFFRRSTDGGATWKSAVNLSKSGNALDPDLAVSGSNIHVVWNQNNQIFARSSTDSGATWNSARNISSTAGDLRVAASGSNVYVTYVRYDYEISTASCGGEVQIELLFVGSKDNGATWKPPVTLYEIFDSCGEIGVEHHLSALGSKAYVIWVVSNYGNGVFFFRASTNYGATWGQAITILAKNGHVEIAASGSSVYLVVWSYGEIYFFRSLDNGATWEPKKNLSHNAGQSNNAQFAT